VTRGDSDCRSAVGGAREVAGRHAWAAGDAGELEPGCFVGFVDELVACRGRHVAEVPDVASHTGGESGEELSGGDVGDDAVEEASGRFEGIAEPHDRGRVHANEAG